MALELAINGSSGQGSRYLTWAPSPCVLRITGTTAAQLGGRVRISNRRKARGGRLVFYLQPTDPPRSRLSIPVPASGSSTVRFWTGGRFGSPSKSDGDTSIVIAGAGTSPPPLVVPVMV